MAFSGGNQICISSPINSQKSTAKPEELDGAAIAFLDDKKTGRQMAMDEVDHWFVSNNGFMWEFAARRENAGYYVTPPFRCQNGVRKVEYN